jgi:hypothetical protein
LFLASAVASAGVAAALVHGAIGRRLLAILFFLFAVARLRFAGLGGAFALAWVLASRAALLLLVAHLLAGALRLRAFGLRLLP